LAYASHLLHLFRNIKSTTETIREGTPPDILGNKDLVVFVCDSTHNFFKELLHLLEENEEFSDVFLEKTERNRAISVRFHPIAENPFTRFNGDLADPILELHLPRVGKTTNTPTLTNSCGQDLIAAVTGTSTLDPINNYSEEDLKGFLPKLKDLPRPALALGQGPIYIRLKESIDGEGYTVEGYPPVLELISEYIDKYTNRWANNRYQMALTSCSWSGKGGYLVVDGFGRSITQVRISPLVIVGLLEGNLGFTRVGEPVAVGSNLVWLFERDDAIMRL